MNAKLLKDLVAARAYRTGTFCLDSLNYAPKNISFAKLPENCGWIFIAVLVWKGTERRSSCFRLLFEPRKAWRKVSRSFLRLTGHLDVFLPPNASYQDESLESEMV